MSEAEQATVELTKTQRAQATAQTAQLYIDMQVLQPDEVRRALSQDGSLNIEDILDNQPEDAQDDGWAALLEGLGEEENLQNFNTQTQVESSIIKGQGNSDRMDSFKESDHPRDKNGKFTGGASSGPGTPPKSSNGLTDAEKRKISERFVGTKTHDGVEIKSFSSHAFDRVGGRKISPGRIEKMMSQGTVSQGHTPNTRCYDHNGSRMVLDTDTGKVVTVMWRRKNR